MKYSFSIAVLFACGLIWTTSISVASADGDIIIGNCVINLKDVQAGGNVVLNQQCGLDEKIVREIVSQAFSSEAAARKVLEDRQSASENVIKVLIAVIQDLTSDQHKNKSLKNSALVALSKGNISPAVQLYKIGLDDTGVPAVDRAKSAYKLGNLYYSKLDNKNALAAYREAMRLDPQNGQYAYVMGTLSLWSLDEPREAVKLFKSARKLDTQQYGADSAAVVRDLDDLSNALRILGEYDNAVDISKEALVIELKKYGPFNPAVSDRYVSIGRALLAGGNYESALDYFNRAQQNYADALPQNDIKMAYLWNYWGDALLEKGWHEKDEKAYTKASSYYNDALNIFLQHLPSSNPWVSTVYENLGRVMAVQGRYRDAIAYYDKALTINRKVYGENHSIVANNWLNIGNSWYHLGNYQQAIHYDQLALTVFASVYGNDHPRTRKARTDLAEAKAALQTRN
jgi:tetratricopeptide (TPR) repeat protein